MAVPWSIADLVHDLSDVAEQFGVRSIPTIVLALRGRELNRIAGARSEPDLIGWVLRQPVRRGQPLIRQRVRICADGQ